MLVNVNLSDLPDVGSNVADMAILFVCGLILLVTNRHMTNQRIGIGIGTMFYAFATCGFGMYISVVWRRYEDASTFTGILSTPEEYHAALQSLANLALTTSFVSLAAVILAMVIIAIGTVRNDSLLQCVGWLYMAQAGFIAGMVVKIGSKVGWEVQEYSLVPLILTFAGLVIAAVMLCEHISKQREVRAQELEV